MAKVQYRIDNTASILLLALAGVADLLSLIPLVGDITSPVVWAIAGYYFYKKGLGIINPRRFAISAVSFLAELIPVLQELPLTMAGIAAIIIMVRAEDKTGLKMPHLPGKNGLEPLNKGGVRSAEVKEPPLNAGNRREPTQKRTDNIINADFDEDNDVEKAA